jgi:hypothetical protein
MDHQLQYCLYAESICVFQACRRKIGRISTSESVNFTQRGAWRYAATYQVHLSRSIRLKEVFEAQERGLDNDEDRKLFFKSSLNRRSKEDTASEEDCRRSDKA